MMKKRIILVLVLLSFFITTPVLAEEVDTDKIYKEQYDKLELENIDGIDGQAKEYLDELNIGDSALNINNFFTADNVFSILSDFFKNGVKTPVKSGISVLVVLLLSSITSNLQENNKTLKYTVAVCLAAGALIPAVSTVKACADAIRTVGTFMLSFLPIFAALLFSSGKPLTSASFSAVMTVAVQTVSSFCSLVFIPLSGMQLSLGISGSASGDVKLNSVQGALKKFSTFGLSLICTVFLTVMGVQTAINSPADNLYSKIAKFVLGAAVPLVGNTVGEALNTVRGCVKLLRSSVMIYGVVAVALIALPIITELIAWRLVLYACGAVADVLDNNKASELIKAVDNSIAMLLGAIVLMLMMFVISLALVTVI